MTTPAEAEAAMMESAKKAGLLGNEDAGSSQNLGVNLHTLDWPSGGAFYGNEARMRSLRFRELILLGTASLSDSLMLFAEAITTTVIGHKGMDITFGDYQFAVYFHRLQISKPITVRWSCEKCAEGALEIAAQSTRIMKGDLKTIRLDPTVNLNPFEDLFLAPPTVGNVYQHLDDQQELRDIQESAVAIADGSVNVPEMAETMTKDVRDRLLRLFIDPESVDKVLQDVREGRRRRVVEQLDDIHRERAYTDKYVLLMDGRKYGRPLQDKRSAFNGWLEGASEDPWNVMSTLSDIEGQLSHGIAETVQVHCGVCGCERGVDIPFTPTDFLPEVDRG